MTFDFNMPSKRAHFELPENHQTVEIGPSKPKLWRFKDTIIINIPYYEKVSLSLYKLLSTLNSAHTLYP